MFETQIHSNEKIYYEFVLLDKHFNSVTPHSSTVPPMVHLGFHPDILSNGMSRVFPSWLRPTMNALLRDGDAPNSQTRSTLDALLKDGDALTVKLDLQWTLS